MWHKSSYSKSNSNCVEVAARPGAVAVRDSKDPDSPVVTFTPRQWGEFMRGVKKGWPGTFRLGGGSRGYRLE